MHKLTDFIFICTTKSNESDSTTGNIIRLKKKLANISLEKEILKKQLSQLYTLFSKLIFRLGKAILLNNIEEISPKVIILVKVET